MLVREKVRGTKLDGAIKIVRGKTLDKSNHTIAILRRTGTAPFYRKLTCR